MQPLYQETSELGISLPVSVSLTLELDSCVNGQYCDGESMICMKDKAVGDACQANKEHVCCGSRHGPRLTRAIFPLFSRCLSYNCDNGTCRKATDAPNSAKKWVYAVVAILIVLSEWLER